MRHLKALVLGLGLAAFSAPAGATVISLTASLDGAQETPPVATPATGSATITYDDVTNLLSWTITFQDLVGTINNAHFHGPAPVGTAASPRISIPFTSGVTSGVLVGSATISEAFETELLAELWYVNIHSTYKAGGEIRGQVTVVPEPRTVALVALGLTALAARRRARG